MKLRQDGSNSNSCRQQQQCCTHPTLPVPLGSLPVYRTVRHQLDLFATFHPQCPRPPPSFLLLPLTLWLSSRLAMRPSSNPPLLGTASGVPIFAMPSTTSTPTTMGSFLLNTHVGRICKQKHNQPAAAAVATATATTVVRCSSTTGYVCIRVFCARQLNSSVLHSLVAYAANKAICHRGCACRHNKMSCRFQAHLQGAGEHRVQAGSLLLLCLDLLHVGSELFDGTRVSSSKQQQQATAQSIPGTGKPCNNSTA